MTDSAILLPQKTLYVQNLNTKTSKAIMLASLNSLFSPFGTVLQIVLIRSPKLRGQAFVIFTETQDATEAKNKMDKFTLAGREMRVDYSKSKSDRVARHDGTYVKREKKVGGVEVKNNKNNKRKASVEVEEAEASEQEAKKAKTDGNHATLGSTTPSKILLVSNLPSVCTPAMLTTLFSQYMGFIEARRPPVMSGDDLGIGFIEFKSEGEAQQALLGLQGFKLTKDIEMRVAFGMV